MKKISKLEALTDGVIAANVLGYDKPMDIAAFCLTTLQASGYKLIYTGKPEFCPEVNAVVQEPCEVRPWTQADNARVDLLPLDRP